MPKHNEAKLWTAALGFGTVGISISLSLAAAFLNMKFTSFAPTSLLTTYHPKTLLPTTWHFLWVSMFIPFLPAFILIKNSPEELQRKISSIKLATLSCIPIIVFIICAYKMGLLDYFYR